MEEKKAQTETFVTTFIYLYSDFPVPLPKKFFLPFLVTYFFTILILLFVFISCIYLSFYFMSKWLASIAVYLFQCVFKFS